MSDCIFCKIAAGDIPANKVYEDDDVVAFHDIKPAGDVHFLLVPKRHVESLAHCGADDAAMLDVAASALNACGAEDDAIALLWAFVERHGHEDAPPAYSLMGLLVQRGDQAGLDRLAQHYQARVPVFALWCQAQMAHKLSDWPALEQLSSVREESVDR